MPSWAYQNNNIAPSGKRQLAILPSVDKKQYAQLECIQLDGSYLGQITIAWVT